MLSVTPYLDRCNISSLILNSLCQIFHFITYTMKLIEKLYSESKKSMLSYTDIDFKSPEYKKVVKYVCLIVGLCINVST